MVRRNGDADIPGTSTNSNKGPELLTSKERISARHVLALMGCMGFVNAYAMRVNLSVAIVAMVDNTLTKNTSLTEDHPGQINRTNLHQIAPDTFAWDENTQNQILGAFFYGYIITQIPGGWFAGRFGGKWLFGLGVLCTSVLTLMTPLAASAGVGWLFAVRVLEGLGEGVTFPAMHAMWGHWAPPLERSKLATFTYAGCHMGTILSSPISGVLCDSNFLGGWPSVFYLYGICGLIWFVLWTLFVFDTPSKHPRISLEEREYIEKSIGPKQKAKISLPLMKIMTSIPVWAIMISQFASNWGYYTLLTNLPNYLKNILNFDISQSGFLFALPYFVSWLALVIGGQLADFMRTRGYLSTEQTRKLFNSLGLGIPAISLAVVGYVGWNKTPSMTCFTLACFGNGLAFSGFGVNHLDIAPRYAGILLGITNFGATITGFLGPTVIGLLTENNNTISQWQIVFWICFGINMLGVLTYLIMASGELQSWAQDNELPEVDDSDHDISETLV